MSIKTILVISMIIVAVNADIVFLNDEAKKACPKYSCKSANSKATETCVLGKGKLTESRTVAVSPCTKDEVCPAKSAIDNLVGDTDVDVKCVATPVAPAVEHFAFPGEACVADKKQCKAIAYYDANDTKVPNADGTCTNNVCVGSLEGKKCDTLDACDLKFFCTGIEKNEKQEVTKSGTCKLLLKKDAEGCTRSKECETGLICLTVVKDATATPPTNVNKCSDLGLLENGTEVKLASPEDGDVKALACKSGVVNPTTSKCSDYKYDADASKIVNGKVSCIPGETCKYNYLIKEEKTADTKPCQCSYDANGSGFCPYSNHDTGAVDKFNGVKKILIENYKRTGVHPENRSITANSDVSKSENCLSVYGDVRYSGVVDCFKTILGADKCTALTSGNFVNYSIVAILAVLAMFF
jgi:hypothetical protein